MNVLIDAKYPNMELKFLIDTVIRLEDGEPSALRLTKSASTEPLPKSSSMYTSNL